VLTSFEISDKISTLDDLEVGYDTTEFGNVKFGKNCNLSEFGNVKFGKNCNLYPTFTILKMKEFCVIRDQLFTNLLRIPACVELLGVVAAASTALTSPISVLIVKGLARFLLSL